MSELSLHIPRCEGRTATSMGQSTLCESCTDCVRRTANRDGARFIEPPQFRMFWTTWICPQYLSPEDDVVEVD